MLIVHHLNNSRSQRVLWLLEELGLPYEIKYYQRDPKTMLAPPELRAIHPLGKSPVVTDGDDAGETGAIVEYLVEKAGGRLRPAGGTPERLRWTYLLHYAEGSLMSPLLMKLVFDVMPRRCRCCCAAWSATSRSARKRASSCRSSGCISIFLRASLASPNGSPGPNFPRPTS